MRGAFGIGAAVALVVFGLGPVGAHAQVSQVSVGVGVGLFDGVSLGFAYDRWSAGGGYTGVSVATGVAASPAGAYGIYSQGYGDYWGHEAYYDVPAYCGDVYRWLDDPWYGGGHAWWAWDDGWGYDGGYWRSAWYRECILAGPPSAYHAFHTANFFRRSYKPWKRYRSHSVFVYYTDPFWNPWGPFWSYEPAWAVAGGRWGRGGQVIVHRPGRGVRSGGVGSPFYRPGVGYKEDPGSPTRTAVPRRSTLADGRTPANVRAPTGAVAPTPRDARVRSGTAAPARGPQAIRTRPSQARPTAGSPGSATRPATRPSTPGRGNAVTRPPATARSGERTAPSRPSARVAPTRPQAGARSGPAARPSAPTRSGPAARPSAPTRSGPAARPAAPTRSGPAARPSAPSRSGPAARPSAPPRSGPAARPAKPSRSGPAARPAAPPRSAPAARPAKPRGGGASAPPSRPPTRARGGGGG